MDECPLWATGMDGLTGCCHAAGPELGERPDSAAWLLRIRKELEAARSGREQRIGREHLDEALVLIARNARAPQRH